LLELFCLTFITTLIVNINRTIVDLNIRVSLASILTGRWIDWATEALKEWLEQNFAKTRQNCLSERYTPTLKKVYIIVII